MFSFSKLVAAFRQFIVGFTKNMSSFLFTVGSAIVGELLSPLILIILVPISVLGVVIWDVADNVALVKLELDPDQECLQKCAAIKFDDLYLDHHPICELSKAKCLLLGKLIIWTGFMSFLIGLFLFWLPVYPFYTYFRRKMFQANHGSFGRAFWEILFFFLIAFSTYYWTKLEEYRIEKYDNEVNRSEVKICCGYFREFAASQLKIVNLTWQVNPFDSMTKICKL